MAASHTQAAAEATVSRPPSPISTSLDERNAGWLKSIDTVYALFEDAALREEYPRLATLVKEAVGLVEEVIKELGVEQCALSYNGGKDCNVLIHIVCAVLRRLSLASSSQSHAQQALPRLPAVYVTCQQPFDAVEAFVGASRIRYNLDLVRVRGGMRQGLHDYLEGTGLDEEKARRTRRVKAIFVGTRRTDPAGASLTRRDPTDAGWPVVERVHPIIDWDYADVWDFLRCPAFGGGGAALSEAERVRTGTADAPGVPYCLLYDQGYTSLGSTFNTYPNPVLRLESTASEAKPSWRPAYMLKDAAMERAGRQAGTPAGSLVAPAEVPILA